LIKFNNAKVKENYFLSQPHQPFFVLGVINALIMMLIFALSYRNIVDIKMDIKGFHVYSLIFLVFTNFFIGFLFTTFSKFCQSENLDRKTYLNIFYLNIFASFLLIFGLVFSQNLLIVGMTLSFISQSYVVLKLYNIYKNGYSQNKKDPFWIFVAFCFGLAGNLLFIVSNYIISLNNIAINLSFYMYVIFLTFCVAQRMIPFFSHSIKPKNDKFISIVFLLFIFQTIASIYDYNIYFKYFEIILDVIFGIYLLKEFIRWKLPIFTSPAILWILHLGLFWLPIALFISALCLSLEIFFNLNFYFLSIHIVAIGFLLTIFIGFGTRVSLGHSGEVPHANLLAKSIFILVQFVLLFRVLFSLNIAFEMSLNFFFDISFLFWIVIFLVWGWNYGKILVFKKA